MAETPYIACPICKGHTRCRGERYVNRQPHAACFTPDDHVDIPFQLRHLRRLAALAGVETAFGDAYWSLLTEPLDWAQGRSSRPIEYSMSFTPDRVSAFRFSLAYFDHQPLLLRQDARHLLELIANAAPELAAVAERTLDGIHSRVVKQLLYGVDWRADGGGRHKFYLRLSDRYPQQKESMLRQLHPLLADIPFTREPFSRTRLVGFDLHGDARPPDIKLYCQYETVNIDAALDLTKRHPFIAYLKPMRPLLRELLTIFRLRPDTPPDPTDPDEVDLHMLFNRLETRDILRFVKQAQLAFPLRSFIDLTHDSVIVPTSVTFPRAPLAKMNLYYLAVEPRRAG